MTEAMKKMMHNGLRFLFVGLVAVAAACGDDDDTEMEGEEEELITTVNVTFASATEMLMGTADLDEDGTATITDPGPLDANTDYAISIDILNESETPVEDVTEEIREEAEEHQIFYVPSGDLSVMVTDVESDYENGNQVGDDLPVGLAATLTTSTAESATLRITLRHLPPINDMVQKTANTMITDGESDFDISFDITVE